EQLTWVREVGRSTSAIAVLVTLVPMAVVGALTRDWLMPLALGLILGFVVVGFTRWTVLVDRPRLTARVALRYPRLRIPLDEIERAEVVTVRPLGEFGGWGLRTGIDGRTGVVLRSGSAVQVHRTGDRVTVVTVDDAETAVAALNTLASRVRNDS